MKLLKPSPHRQRNDFDLSHRHVFDANFGELLPATCIETVPGDNITLHASDLLRAIPFVSSPFLRAKQHLDVWFVPYHDLWHNFDQFITQRDEPVSSSLKQHAYLPHTSIYDLKTALSDASTNSLKDVIGRDVSARSNYLLQLLGYGDVENARANSYDSSLKVNLMRLAAYNYIWYNEYRQQYYDDGKRLLSTTSTLNVAQLFNFDDLDCATQATSRLGSNISNNLKRIQAMCQMRYRTWKKDLFTGVLPSTQFGSVSIVPINGNISVSGSATLSGVTGTDRNRHRFADSNGVEFTQDQLNNTGFTYPVSGIETGINLPFLRSHLDPGDFEDAPLNQRFLKQNSSVQLSDMLSTNIYGGEYTASGAYTGADGRAIFDHHTHEVSGSATISSAGTLSGVSFDVLSLRKYEAIQIWRENALRAGNRVSDNMMAHYGVASDFNDHRPTYLGSVSSPLNIGDIAATANSDGINNTLGDIAGKGLSSLDEKVFKFHSKDFGVIMVMFSMLPEAEYDAKGIERTNQLLESEDFFVPEYENLGLEAVSNVNFYPRLVGSDFIIGYAPRYYAYKTKLDKVFGSFVGSGIFRSWSSQRTDVSQVLELSTTVAMPLSLLYVNPQLFDANFNVGISVSPQFLCDLYFDVDAVRPMSVTGLPFS